MPTWTDETKGTPTWTGVFGSAGTWAGSGAISIPFTSVGYFFPVNYFATYIPKRYFILHIGTWANDSKGSPSYTGVTIGTPTWV